MSFLLSHICCYLGYTALCNIVENVEFDRHKMWGLNYSHHSINFLVYSSAGGASGGGKSLQTTRDFPAYKDRHRHSLIIILLRIRHHYFLFFPCLILLRTNLNCRRNCSTRMRPLSIFLVENECTIYLENYKSKRTLYSIRAKVVNK